MAKSNFTNLSNGIKTLCETPSGQKLYRELIAAGQAIMNCLKGAYEGKQDIRGAEQLELTEKMKDLISAAMRLVPELYDEWDFKNTNSVAMQLDQFLGRSVKK